MTLDEMEAQDQDVDSAITCELVVEDEEDEDQKLDEWTDKIMCHLFGAAGKAMKGRKQVRKLLSKAVGEMDEIENDLAESLDLLQDALAMMERILSKHQHTSLRTEMINHMEEVHDWLSNWGMEDTEIPSK